MNRGGQLSRCGRKYGTRETAANSRTAGKPGAVVTECRCGSWHVRFPGRRKPLKTVSDKKARTPSKRQVRLGVGTAPGASSAWKRLGSGLKAFPRKVAALIDRRDDWCQRCGSPGPLHRHHRRAKGIGGDTRAHAQCACNGVRLCCVDRETGEIGGCHRWVHLHPERARAEGWIVSQEADEPGRVSVMRGSEDGGGASMYPHCDGTWREYAPEAVEAA